MPPPANPPAEPAETELDRVDKALKGLGYAKIKQGSVNVPGFRLIQTWIKRGQTIYLLFNEAGHFDILQSAFFGDPTVEGIAEAFAKG